MELSRDALWANRFLEEGLSAPEGLVWWLVDHQPRHQGALN